MLYGKFGGANEWAKKATSKSCKSPIVATHYISLRVSYLVGNGWLSENFVSLWVLGFVVVGRIDFLIYTSTFTVKVSEILLANDPKIYSTHSSSLYYYDYCTIHFRSVQGRFIVLKFNSEIVTKFTGAWYSVYSKLGMIFFILSPANLPGAILFTGMGVQFYSIHKSNFYFSQIYLFMRWIENWWMITWHMKRHS